MARPAKALSDAEKKAKEAEKRTKFVDLGSKRVGNALAGIRKIAPLANKSAYSFTEEDIAKIETAINNEVDNLMNAFKAALAGKKVSSGSGFTF